MIILDTNVLSELMRPSPSEEVLRWMDRWPAEALFTTAITIAEMAYGIALLEDGARKQGLRLALDGMRRDLGGRIVPFDQAAAECYGELAATTRREGRQMDTMDALIASIALARRATLATRNGRDFQYCGLDVVNPWTV